MSISFPASIMKPSYAMPVLPEDTSIRSKFEDGAVQGRRKFTGHRNTYDVTWNALPQAQDEALLDFINNTIFYSAQSFLWTRPDTGTVIEVYLTQVKKNEITGTDKWNVEIELQEV
jgi:phage-related protein